MKIQPSYFDYGKEIDVCDVFQIDDKFVRLTIRRVKDQYELYTHTYGTPIYPEETIIKQGSLEEVVEIADALMRARFGIEWEGETIIQDNTLKEKGNYTNDETGISQHRES